MARLETRRFPQSETNTSSAVLRISPQWTHVALSFCWAFPFFVRPCRVFVWFLSMGSKHLQRGSRFHYCGSDSIKQKTKSIIYIEKTKPLYIYTKERKNKTNGKKSESNPSPASRRLQAREHQPCAAPGLSRAQSWASGSEASKVFESVPQCPECFFLVGRFGPPTK